MVRARLCALLGLCLMLAAASTEAREIEFMLENRLGGDSNVLRTRTNGRGETPADGFWEITPSIFVREDRRDDVSYDFRYQPTYEQFFGTDDDTEGINGVDHSVRGLVDWRVTPADNLAASVNFNHNRRLRFQADTLGLDQDPTPDSTDRERTTRSRLNLSYRKGFTPAFSGRVEYGLDYLGFNRRASADSRAHSATVGADYVLNRLTTVGISSTARFRDGKFHARAGFFNTGPIQEIQSQSQTYDVSFSIRRALAETLDASLSVGPSWVNSRQFRREPDISSPLEGTTRDSTNSVFVAASLTKRWQDGNARFSYTRSESGGGSNGSASIVDTISLSGRYSLNRVWTLTGVASWNQRQELSADGFIFGADRETERWITIWTLQRRLTGNLTIQGRFQYSLQNQNDDDHFTRAAESEIISGFVGLRYTFDPIVF